MDWPRGRSGHKARREVQSRADPTQRPLRSHPRPLPPLPGTLWTGWCLPPSIGIAVSSRSRPYLKESPHTNHAYPSVSFCPFFQLYLRKAPQEAAPEFLWILEYVGQSFNTGRNTSVCWAPTIRPDSRGGKQTTRGRSKYTMAL